MSEPCMCGAEDCKLCFPLGCADEEEDDYDDDNFPDPSDDDVDDDIADYVCEGYKESRY